MCLVLKIVTNEARSFTRNFVDEHDFDELIVELTEKRLLKNLDKSLGVGWKVGQGWSQRWVIPYIETKKLSCFH